jgi:hypothetical protein
MGRPQKSDSEKARNAGFTAYQQEIDAIQNVARLKQFKSSFDYLRALVIQDDHPKARGKIVLPRKILSEKPGPTLSPHSRRRPRV